MGRAMQSLGSTQIFFWRTGETSKSQPEKEKEKRSWHGSENKSETAAEPSLTAKGFSQAEDLGNWIKASKISICFFVSSPARAAKQTMETALAPSEYATVHEFREVGLGDL